MRIGIDARFLTHSKPGGYQTYVQELLAAFNRAHPPHELWLILAADTPPLSRVSDLPRVIEPVPVPFAGVGWREQWRLPHVARRLRLDLMHYPSNTMPWKPLVPSIATLHDTMATRRQPNSGSARSALIRAYEGFAVRKTLRNARLVLTGSEAVASDAIAAGLPADRVRTIGYGVREDFWRDPNQKELDEFCQRQGLSRPYLLTMTSADPRKNVDGAIRAFAQGMHAHPTLTLVVLLAANDLRHGLEATVAQIGAGDRVRFLDRVETGDMPALYAAASATLFLSLHEGFGLPPLESMACGTPVICSERRPMTTLYGDSVLLVEPSDLNAVAAAIDRVMVDQTLRRQLVTRGRETAARFSWDRAARDTIRAYEEAVSLA